MQKFIWGTIRALIFINVSFGFADKPDLPALDNWLSEIQEKQVIKEFSRIETIEAFNPESVSSFDYKNGIILYRGNAPFLVDESSHPTSFDYFHLLATLKEVASQNSLPFSDKPFLIVITLLDNIKDKQAVKLEENFFKENSDLGQVYNSPLFGAKSAPSEFNDEVAWYVAMRDPIDQLPAKMKTLQNLILTHDTNTVIYIHCENGNSVTGEYVGAYLMTFYGLSLDEFLIIMSNNQTPLENENINALKWYEIYLNELRK